jgi:hypothetical protein
MVMVVMAAIFTTIGQFAGSKHIYRCLGITRTTSHHTDTVVIEDIYRPSSYSSSQHNRYPLLCQNPGNI